MAKVSMLIGDAELAEIDAQAGGNRTAFMVAAAVERARLLRRERIDREIEATFTAEAELNAEVYRDWEITIGDGLD
jgi:hypothetical protein